MHFCKCSFFHTFVTLCMSCNCTGTGVMKILVGLKQFVKLGNHVFTNGSGLIPAFAI